MVSVLSGSCTRACKIRPALVVTRTYLLGLPFEGRNPRRGRRARNPYGLPEQFHAASKGDISAWQIALVIGIYRRRAVRNSTALNEYDLPASIVVTGSFA